MSRPKTAFLVVAVAAALASDAGALRAETPNSVWPFGPPSERTDLRRRDLYNLGMIGAKARNADRPEPEDLGSGIHSFKFEGDGRLENEGPDRLRVELLFPDGPGAKAGLRIGDVITGVNDEPFAENSLGQIARALSQAETGRAKGGIVRLSVTREGAKEPLTVSVVLPVTDKDGDGPSSAKQRDLLSGVAAKWLASRQLAGGGFPRTVAGTASDVCQTSIVGLAWLATGSDLKKGPYAERLRRAATHVAATALAPEPTEAVDRTASSQVHWGLSTGAIFLGELQARSPDPAVADALRKIAAELVKNQEASGGWAHGPGGPNPLGYVELNIVTGLALGGLGLAQRAGADVPESVRTKAERYLEASSGSDGGVGYSSRPEQAGTGNIGRTAGCWLGALTLGQRNAPFSMKMEDWIGEHAGDVFQGHASLMLQILLAGVAAHARGGGAPADFWAVCEREAVLARAPDGSFQPRAWRESLELHLNSDVNFGEVWTTAAWAVVLACEPVKGGRPGLPAWMGMLPPPLPPPLPPKRK